ncbi:unknown [Prevotella sp. CAG:5226]|nr:unknown [Prevotella sp. CAG:5226]
MGYCVKPYDWAMHQRVNQQAKQSIYKHTATDGYFGASTPCSQY